MQTLIVKYLPSGEGSNTKKILDVFLSKIEKSSIEFVDLLKTEYQFLTNKTLMLITKEIIKIKTSMRKKHHF